MENLEQEKMPVDNQGIEKTEEKKKPSDFNISWATVFVSVLMSTLVSLITLVIYTKFVTPQVYTIRVDEILADHIRTIGASNLTDAQKQQIASAWSEAFDQSIKNVYANKNVVLTQQAVVIGGTDYTTQLKQEIAAKMNANPNLANSNSPSATSTK
ncbi:TrbI F-type domain-containing protein [Acinetobacter seifertii]|uniref:TrbI F-type domain-containing protein n=1 Tax=Acinetobacter seifertii TaxID=1530123 RepID=UPI00280C788B|nr:TrbI F-type domain-containing protein [Acinetobacter seifertii]MDQ9038421.1 TrbI F-type domain-containing protein [Acinetobacter seifertii]